ncbi:MAG: Ig-like domain-containing protein [Gammaproteobacteria bacterium]|nr:Ig-like domain-containing protein [Gammaproteobacteria bacterium]
MKPKLFPVVVLVSLFSLAGCNDSSDHDFEASAEDAQETYEAENEIQPRPLFNPAEGQIPSATDLLFLGSTDGTLNIPIDPLVDSEGEQLLKATLNELDGFSTTSPITVEFSTTLDPASVTAGGTVHLYEVTTTSDGAVLGVTRELSADEYVTTLSGENLEILVMLPLVPLQEQTSYLVVFTSGITDAAGAATKADTVYRVLKSTEPLTGELAELEPLRLLTQTFEAAAASQGIPADEIVLSWVFSTQSITPVLDYLADTAVPGTISLAPTGLTTQELNPLLQGTADVYIGTLDVPYYLTDNQVEPTAPLTEYWTGTADSALTRYNTIPVVTSTQTIPVLLTLPNETSAPAEGWPLVIFQHGITQDRTNLLGIADTLAMAGFAAVAIDLPLHGITDRNNALHADLTIFPEDVERTFDLDLVDNATGAAGPDDAIDPSGQHYINLQSLLTSRDNLRQAVADLLVLRASLSGITGIDLNADQVHFVGHSLGGIAGSVYLAMDETVLAASLAMPGGGIARMLDGSATFGPIVEAGLAANGVIKGTADYESFMVVAQTAVDSADPINFAALAAVEHPIHMIEVIGGGGNLPDQVIPNSVVGAPLSGTEPLARMMALESITTTTASDGIVRFTEGEHSSVLDLTASPAATAEMQSEIAGFLASGGTLIPITNPNVISQ